MTYLRPTALGLACGFLWGFCMLFLYVTSTLWGYGQEWVDLMNTVYLADNVTNAGLQVVIGTGMAFLDGFIGGALLAWLYNQFS